LASQRFSGNGLPRGVRRLSFVCNICGMACRVPTPELHREAPSCSKCQSNVRFRSVIAALSLALHGTSLTLDDFPKRPDIIGLGTSDWEGYAIRLRRVFGYDNTYYDEETRLDITAPVPAALVASCDFIITSDVLEHVSPPYELALANLRKLLKPGGLLVLTVPMRPEGSTAEHYPELYHYKIVTLGDENVLVNRTRSGELQVFGDLVFHGGPGVTLEMRMFALPDLLDSLRRVGFVDVAPFDQPILEHGIVWNEACTWPITAQAPEEPA
jgi:SAM-dependent methyltransferase